ncbi:hypothetical protein BpHYR1_048063 [Brachionus plicatilis]|uniref:Uncharacterized protein n=1 Tax=Brachionus plicatilis TaxID=10195 RepID=A0A3M7S287_BRAPC|nr:hypothetical protein BpHYR1_048063 [Brachionus plicatilis]
MIKSNLDKKTFKKNQKTVSLKFKKKYEINIFIISDYKTILTYANIKQILSQFTSKDFFRESSQNQVIVTRPMYELFARDGNRENNNFNQLVKF